MKYNRTVKLLKSFIPTNKKKWQINYRLDTVREFFKLLGNPQENLNFIHIGGTSGKGSTATFLSSILTESGYKTGLHVSPDILTIRERMQINGVCISKERFVEIFEQIKPSIDKMIKKYGFPPSYYEILLAMAFIYFKAEHCELVVLEVGLGGKLDATNVIDCAFQIITNIGLDHTAILGSTKKLILSDKQEIIKQGSIVISGITEPDLQNIIKKKALDTKSKISLLNKNFKIQNIIKNSDNTNTFDLVADGFSFTGLKIGLKGLFQVQNAALAIVMAKKLTKRYPKINLQSIRLGIVKPSLPGRFQIFSTEPLGIIDGAHNPDKISALVRSIKYLYPDIKFITIFRYKKRNDIDQSLNLLKQISLKIIITKSIKSGDMGLDPVYDQEDQMKYAKDGNFVFEPNLRKAYNLAKILTKGNQTGLLVTGSLYMIDEFLKII